jgi:uncharacterized repeat protein (TIGR03803 family)
MRSWSFVKIMVGLAAYSLLGVASSGSAHATGTVNVLWTFCQTHPACPSSGAHPGPLIEDSSGNLFGVAQTEGTGSSNAGDGKVYELSPNGSGYAFKSLYVFCSLSACSEGQHPVGKLVIDTSGNLYGVTKDGGAYGYGSVFELSPGSPWTLTTLYSFCPSSATGCIDGQAPDAGLTYVGTGAYNGSATLYGVTSMGGAYGFGEAFKLASPTSAPSLTVLYSFSRPCPAVFMNNCSYPTPSALIADSSGNLYGDTSFGGNTSWCTAANRYGCGTVYELSPQTGGFSYTLLWNLCQAASGTCTDAKFPVGPLAFDSSGNLTATAMSGGANQVGALFDVVPGTTPSESVTYSFCNTGSCPNSPQGGLWIDSSNQYGTANAGGSAGDGALFAFSGGTLTNLWNFCTGSCTDSGLPQEGVIEDSSGNLFGVNAGFPYLGVPTTVFEYVP